MCGVFATLPALPIQKLERLISCLAHRGPDSNSYEVNEFMAIGMTRLAIFESNVDDQPNIGCNRNIVTVLNGEIYNYSSLREELIQKGHKFKSKATDASVIPHLYEEYGDLFASKLEGMFAIIIWDEDKKMLMLIRDSMGIKPLYYCQEKEFVAASEIGAILEILTRKPDLSIKSFFQLSKYGIVFSPNTVYENVHSVIPGTILKIYVAEKNRIETYRWNKKIYEIKRYKDKDEAEILDELDSLLRESVNQQSKHGENTSILLSGGLDSSIIASYLRENNTGVLDSYHLVFEESSESKKIDQEIARKIAEKFSFNHTEVRLNAFMYFSKLNKCLDSMKQPFLGVTSTYFIAEEIAKKYKVCLTGDGADELFGSYSRVQHFAKIYYDQVSQSEINYLKQNDFINKYRLSKKQTDFENGEEVSVSNWDKNDNILKKTLNQDFEGALLFDQLRLLPDQVLLYSDHLAMAYSLEMRPPFLSKSIIEFARLIPLELLIDSKGETKKVLKLIATKYLPTEIVHRKKEGFLIPLKKWLRHPAGIDWIEENLEHLNGKLPLDLDYNKIQDFIKHYINLKHDNYFEVYKLLVITRFLTKYQTS